MIDDRKYLTLLSLNLRNFRPWRILDQDQNSNYTQEIKERYPNRKLIPFAVRVDCDDIACWDLSKESQKIYIIHDFASEGWEEQAVFENFEAWMESVLRDMYEFNEAI